eukprot:COSAG05_NODE_1988_length_3739_cov_33.369505_3_plen_96_part_00
MGRMFVRSMDRLVHWLKQALLRVGCVPSSPQTHARRNVARGVEVLRGTPPPRHRARAPRLAVMIMYCSEIISHESILIHCTCTWLDSDTLYASPL